LLLPSFVLFLDAKFCRLADEQLTGVETERQNRRDNLPVLERKYRRRIIMKKLYITLVLLGSMMTVMGCGNTVDGVEKDLDKAADAVKDATN